MFIDKEIINSIARQYGTPFFLYDIQGIKSNINLLNSAFSWSKDFCNYFPIKALPREQILINIKRFGCGIECCSLSELELAKKIGYRGEQIIYTCLFPYDQELIIAKELGVVINLDYAANITRVLDKYIPNKILFRFNPGYGIIGNRILGVPSESKFGSPEKLILDSSKIAIKKGVKNIGLHGMFASNSLDISLFQNAAKIMFRTAQKILNETGTLFMINLGGGIGIPYRPEQHAINIQKLGNAVKSEFINIFKRKELNKIKIAMECGRFLTGPNGILVTKVLQLKKTYRRFAFVDASATNYPRPGVYGGYNKIEVIGKEKWKIKRKYNVVGLLCDGCDQFCVERLLPEIHEGDLLVISDAGAHAAAMSYDYNGRLRCNEFMLTTKGEIRQIRLAQTVASYISGI